MSVVALREVRVDVIMNALVMLDVCSSSDSACPTSHRGEPRLERAVANALPRSSLQSEPYFDENETLYGD
jgi:cysteine sulfinate desulfinase/cysteine desulfurase-like protein